MEDQNKPTQQPNPAPTAPRGNVMDVQPPHSAMPVSPAPAPVEPAGLAAEPSPNPLTAPIGSIDAPNDAFGPGPAASPAPSADAGLSSELLAQAQAETNKLDSSNQKPTKHKSGKPKLVIFIAILVALALAGGAVYAYMQSNKKDKAPTNHDTHQMEEESSSADPATKAATADDVDTTSKEVDEAISTADAAASLPESELSDQALGL